MSNDEQPITDSGFGYHEGERSSKEAIIVTLLFVGVVGMSMALVGLDVDFGTTPGAPETGEEIASAQALDSEGLFDSEAIAKAAAIPPGELVSRASEALIQEILYEDETVDLPESQPADVAPGADGRVDPAPGADHEGPQASSEPSEKKALADPYNDLIMVGDAETPVRDAQGQQVKLSTPKTRVTTSPRALLPDAPAESESEERASNPLPRGEAEESAALPPAPPPTSASSKETLSAQMTAAKTRLRGGDPVGAAREYKKALSMGGGAGARLGLAKAQYEMGNTKQAQRELKKVLGTNPRSGGALLLMGSIAQGQGDRAGARSYYQKFLNAHPNSKRAERIRGILTRL